jgi:hypothetical protein
MSRSLRNPEKQDDHKKRDVEQSAPTHAVTPTAFLCSWVLQPIEGMTFIVTDIEKHAKWQRYIEEPTPKNFVVRKVRTIEWNKVQGTIWNAINCKEHLRSCPAAVVRQATISLTHEFRNPMGIPVSGCTALT